MSVMALPRHSPLAVCWVVDGQPRPALANQLISALCLPRAVRVFAEDRAKIHLQQRLFEVRLTESVPGALLP